MTIDIENKLPNARVSIITLGVSDLVSATEFYQKLGWKKSDKSQDSISFLKGSNIILGLYGREELAKDVGVENTPPGFSGISLALNMPDEEAVDLFVQLAKSAGAKVVKQPQKVFWGGYSGYFSDLDGHLWEIAHNPFVGFDAQGNLDLDGDVTS